MAKKLPRLTLGLTYFNDEKWIHEWYHQFKFYPSEVEIIIFDDASDHSPIEEVLYPIRDMPDHTAEISLYKVTKDLGFNSHGCRNAIAKLAKSELLCFFDILAWDLFLGLVLSSIIFKISVAIIDTPLLYLLVGLIRKKFSLGINDEIDID